MSLKTQYDPSTDYDSRPDVKIGVSPVTPVLCIYCRVPATQTLHVEVLYFNRHPRRVNQNLCDTCMGQLAGAIRQTGY